MSMVLSITHVDKDRELRYLHLCTHNLRCDSREKYRTIRAVLHVIEVHTCDVKVLSCTHNVRYLDYR